MEEPGQIALFYRLQQYDVRFVTPPAHRYREVGRFTTQENVPTSEPPRTACTARSATRRKDQRKTMPARIGPAVNLAPHVASARSAPR